jgi:hypothetical protein
MGEQRAGPGLRQQAERARVDIRSCRGSVARSASSGIWPDCLGTVRAAVLQKARALERETHALACVELPVARHFNAGEMDKAATWHLSSVDHAPAFVSVEPLDHACHSRRLRGRPSRHGRSSHQPPRGHQPHVHSSAAESELSGARDVMVAATQRSVRAQLPITASRPIARWSPHWSRCRTR